MMTLVEGLAVDPDTISGPLDIIPAPAGSHNWDLHYCLCSASGSVMDISEPACTYCVCIFVQYDLIYFDVLAEKYMQIRTKYIPNTS